MTDAGDAERLRELADKATEPPWSTHHAGVNQNGELMSYVGLCGPTVSIHDVTGACSFADAEFIAAARNLLPTLLDERDADKAEIERLKTWQAKRIVAISQDPVCIRWMRQSEQLSEELAAAEARADALQRAVDAAETICKLTIAYRPSGDATLAQQRTAMGVLDALGIEWDRGGYLERLTAAADAPQPEGTT